MPTLPLAGEGHSRKILEANSATRLLAMDCDPDAGGRASSLEESTETGSGLLTPHFSRLISMRVPKSLMESLWI